MVWPPMSDRENGLGWCMGAEVKNFGKDIMETQSSEYGFILYLLKCKVLWILGGNLLEKCIECDGEYPIYNVLIVFICSYL